MAKKIKMINKKKKEEDKNEAQVAIVVLPIDEEIEKNGNSA